MMCGQQQGQQRCRRQDQPEALDTFGISHSCLLPLQSSALEALEALFDPTAQAVPLNLHLIDGQVTDQQPWITVLRRLIGHERASKGMLPEGDTSKADRLAWLIEHRS